MIVAVDFDGVLHDGKKFPDIGNPRKGVFHHLIEMRKQGHKVILWSCREGRNLTDAVMFCNEQGLHFDAINDNLPSMREKYGNNSRKVFADLYIDDKGMDAVEFMQWRRQMENVKKSKEYEKVAKVGCNISMVCAVANSCFLLINGKMSIFCILGLVASVLIIAGVVKE